MTKFEDMEYNDIVEAYINLKINERERNSRSYQKLQEDKQKYFARLDKNLEYQLNRLDDIKEDKQKLEEYKKRRKEINKRAYMKKKLENLNI